jgi:hypothetical protein
MAVALFDELRVQGDPHDHSFDAGLEIDPKRRR